MGAAATEGTLETSGCSTAVRAIRRQPRAKARLSPTIPSTTSSSAASRGPQDLPWYTIRTESFAEDFGASSWFALNVFLRDGDDVYRTYFLQDNTMVGYTGSVRSLLSITPYGQQIEGEEVPEGWPQAPWEFWMRRHDEFHDAAPAAS